MSQNRVPDFVAQTVLALAVGSFEGPSCALVTCHVLFKALPDFLVPGEAPGLPTPQLLLRSWCLATKIRVLGVLPVTGPPGTELENAHTSACVHTSTFISVPLRLERHVKNHEFTAV